MSSPEDLAEIEAALATLRRHAGEERTAARVFDGAIELIRRYHRSLFWGDRMLFSDHAAGFLGDPAFQQAISSASSSTGENQYASPNGISWRFHTLIWAARQALSVPGDFVAFVDAALDKVARHRQSLPGGPDQCVKTPEMPLGDAY